MLSSNVREGGMVDGHLRRVVMFPDDGHPDPTYYMAPIFIVPWVTGIPAHDREPVWRRHRQSLDARLLLIGDSSPAAGVHRDESHEY
jgi:hypothetical protein